MQKMMEVEGKNVIITTNWSPKVGEYGVYDNKIWRAVASSGVGVDYKLTIEREQAKEKITLSGERLREVYLLLKPTGHITV